MEGELPNCFLKGPRGEGVKDERRAQGAGLVGLRSAVQELATDAAIAG